jgi:NitT/TauT family transport system permease protein
MKKIDISPKFIFALTLLFVYIILFEFILPLNRVLPKPSILYESLIDVWNDYNLIFAMSITTSIVYFSLLISYFISRFISILLIKIEFEFPSVIEKVKIFQYFPAFFFAIIFIFWFEDNIVYEFVFTLLFSSIALCIVHVNEVKSIKENYLLVAKNLGLSTNQIYSKVVLKSIQPKVFASMNKIHYQVWILVMIYEFIANINGFGGVYKDALSYSDFSGLFAIALIIALLIFIGNIGINFTYKKLFFWINDKN